MADYSDIISRTENTYGLPRGMLSQLLRTESGLDPHAVNRVTGAIGLAQALPATARDPGYGIRPFDPTDPAASIDFAGHYLKALKDQTGSWENAIRHYGTLAGVAGMSYAAQPQNPNQALLLSLARHGDTPSPQPQPDQAPGQLMRSAPDPNQPAAQAPGPTMPIAPPLSSVVGASPKTAPPWIPQWVFDLAGANTAGGSWGQTMTGGQ